MLRTTLSSIHNLQPLEEGGPTAREGFDFQDHVAASFCIEMLTSPRLLQVWCETHDDITLIWQDAANTNIETVEFIQVKANELDQHWSVAKLCERDSGDSGKSILQKSLGQDRCKEETYFRLVTLCDVNSALAILTKPLESLLRHPEAKAIKELCAQVNKHKHIAEARSEKGNDSSYWISRVFWDVRGVKNAVKNDNLIKLNRLLFERGEYLAPDQLEEIYEKLLRKTQAAATARAAVNPALKRIRKEALLEWLEDAIRTTLHPASTGEGLKLRTKMHVAGLAQDIIDDAVEIRESYRLEILSPQYLSLSETKKAQGEVVSHLHDLRSQLDANRISDNGSEFHSRCLEALRILLDSQKLDPKATLRFLQGCMYDITNRCRHRFVRAKA